MTEEKIETLFEINTPDGLFAEAFTTSKGTFLTLNRNSCTITITQDDIRMLLKTVKLFEKNADLDYIR